MAGVFTLFELTEGRGDAIRSRLGPALVLGMVLLFAAAVYRQVRVGLSTAAEHRSDAPDFQLLSWAREHISTDAVVGAAEVRDVILIPVVAGTWTYVPLGDRSVAPQDEVLARIVRVLKLTGRSLAEIQDALLLYDGCRVAEQRTQYSCAMFYREINKTEVYEETPRLFADTSRATFENSRLDYLMMPIGAPRGVLMSMFPESRDVFKNERYALVELRPEGPAHGEP